jgi:hypothetical protein
MQAWTTQRAALYTTLLGVNSIDSVGTDLDFDLDFDFDRRALLPRPELPDARALTRATLFARSQAKREAAEASLAQHESNATAGYLLDLVSIAAPEHQNDVPEVRRRAVDVSRSRTTIEQTRTTDSNNKLEQQTRTTNSNNNKQTDSRALLS